MNQKTRTLFLFFIGAFAGMLAMYLYNNYTIEKKNNIKITTQSPNSEISKNDIPDLDKNFEILPEQSVDELTNEKAVIAFVKKNHQLPEYYITKNEAKLQGWIPSENNLCEVLPGKAIGGDKFTNREKQLPKGQQYYEADVNYNCGRRNADRIVFTKNGDVYLTKNHYKTFEKQ